MSVHRRDAGWYNSQGIARAKRGMPRAIMMREYYKINRIKDFDKQIERFWDKNEKKIDIGWNIHLEE